MAKLFSKIKRFFRNSFKDMAESTGRQHEINKANSQRIKYEFSISVQRLNRKEQQEKALEEAIRKRDIAKARYEKTKSNNETEETIEIEEIVDELSIEE